jgi:octaprenyl-diphosphate synthase
VQDTKKAPEFIDLPLERVRALVAGDLTELDRTIRRRLASDVALVNQVGEYIVGGGGKRLRPLLVIVAARACDYGGPHHVEAAAIIEFIHTATLLHDDVVDGSELRRGQDTANALFGNQASVLVGDFLYSRAFQMMTDIGHPKVMDILADATNLIAEGEVLQLLNVRDPDTSEARYLEVINRKTAMLFEAGTRIAAIIAGQPETIELALAEYGRRLGVAFQLVDDALDYSASAEALGKNVGDDLAEGKPTLPLIHAIHHGPEVHRQMLRRAIESGGLEDLTSIRDAIESSGGLEYTARLARREADAAIAALGELPDSTYRDALIALAKIAVERNH